MTTEEALAVLQQVCAVVQGTLADHQKIQAALQVVIAACTPEPVED
jgi:hypothetical protein